MAFDAGCSRLPSSSWEQWGERNGDGSSFVLKIAKKGLKAVGLPFAVSAAASPAVPRGEN